MGFSDGLIVGTVCALFGLSQGYILSAHFRREQRKNPGKYKKPRYRVGFFRWHFGRHGYDVCFQCDGTGRYSCSWPEAYCVGHQHCKQACYECRGTGLVLRVGGMIIDV